jgi:hypothetical protein
MGRPSQARSRSGYRRSRRLRRDRRGVVAVVGTLLALLVFFSLFGVFLTQYVPLWMEQNESQFSNGLIASLATLKSGVDDQYTLGGIPAYSVPFTVSSESVPLFAQPTIATLAYLSGCPGGFVAGDVPSSISGCAFEKLAFSSGAKTGTNNPFGQTAPTNYLQVSDPNRYYPPENYYFEDDAIVGEQSTAHQWMIVPPPFNVTKTPGNISVQASMLILEGNATSFSSVGSKDVTSHLASHVKHTSPGWFLTTAGAPRMFNATLTLGVYGMCAWYNFLNNETTYALGAASSSTWSLTITGASGTVTPPLSFSTCLGAASITYDLTLVIHSVSYASVYVAQDQLSFNAGGL